MRHFAAELRLRGWLVTYSISDDFETALLNWIKENRIDEVRIMSPNDRPFTQLINKQL
jgi:deoxyribodipyrimidine photolyase-related protein